MKKRFIMISILAFLFVATNVNATTFAEELISKANGIDVTNYEDGNVREMYTFKHDKTEQTPELTDYRYIGLFPLNTVYFNCKDDDNTSTCEKWEIIGVFPVEDENGKVEQRVKLIGPVTPNGFFLNSKFEYINSDDLSYSSKLMIKDAKYYVGGNITGDLKNISGSDWYEKERGRETNHWIGKVNLMYLSDYVYTHALGVQEECFSSIYDCPSYLHNPNASWLYAPSSPTSAYGQWTLIGIPITKYGFVDKNATGFIKGRPVVYLRADTQLIGGDGTGKNPYQITVPTSEEETEKPKDEDSKKDENSKNDVAKKTKILKDRILFDATNETSKEAAIKKILGKVQPNFNNLAKTEEGLFKTEDDYGDSYYYRGKADNYVLYAGYLWQVIRINGDGSIRLIYAGTQDDYTGKNTAIEAGPYNSNYDVSYVSSDGTNSSIKTIIDEWYEKNILDEKDEDGNSLTSYLADSSFCNDRSKGVSNYFGTSDRIITDKNPSLKCSKEDSLTVSNGSLKYPIATITVDEVALAGGTVSEGNSKYYLNTNQCYWTMSPSSVFENSTRRYTYMFYIPSTGEINSLISVGSCGGVRPVINLKSNVYVSTGDGTLDNPYQATLTEPKDEPSNSNSSSSKPSIENPSTSDNLVKYVIISLIGLFGLTVSVFKAKKQSN